ncbi:uncharacterized protein YciI [Volucribacter psittacicida]|uniref:Uncharacterized protein YciI n=1 Tax=Volucribacter psittacicida TaxID=203482 RepID=A0A4R1FGY1_9PAST|nr:YciI family protein [Volucribacter psittacicida]TCJ94026.1 uncharacterized protein YciI [Volucribacter psittacicida]
MFLINVTVKAHVSEQQQQALLPSHVAWIQKYIEQGVLVLAGPYTDTPQPSGLLIANVESRAELEKVLAEDCFYPELADYQVREFEMKFVTPISSWKTLSQNDD